MYARPWMVDDSKNSRRMSIATQSKRLRIIIQTFDRAGKILTSGFCTRRGFLWATKQTKQHKWGLFQETNLFYRLHCVGSPGRYVLKIHFFVNSGLKMIQFKTKSEIFIQKNIRSMESKIFNRIIHSKKLRKIIQNSKIWLRSPPEAPVKVKYPLKLTEMSPTIDP